MLGFLNSMNNMDEQTVKNYMKKFNKFLNQVDEIHYLMQRQAGKVPVNEQLKEEELENIDQGRRTQIPFIYGDDTKIFTEEKIINLEKQSSGIANSGHIANTHSSNKMYVSWNNGGEWTLPYPLASGEILDFKGKETLIKKISVKPYNEGAEFSFKCIFS